MILPKKIVNPAVSQECIEVIDAFQNNLKHISLKIPKNKLTVITGVSGCGKSSLAFDTLYAEGQRRYVESLSSYARQFVGKLEKPLVQDIKGLSPAIAVQQKVITSNPRSTVGTTTEIYDYLRLLFARIGKTISPVSGKEVKKHSVADVLDAIKKHSPQDNLCILVKIEGEPRKNFSKHLSMLKSQGFTKLWVGNSIQWIEDLESFGFEPDKKTDIFLVIEQFNQLEADENFYYRLTDSIELAFYEGHGRLFLYNLSQPFGLMEFSNLFEADGISFTEPDIHFFSFNNPVGACPRCEGYGKILGIDEDLVVPDKSLSLYDGAIACWKGDTLGKWRDDFLLAVKNTDFPVFKPYYELSEVHKDMLWNGVNGHPGIYGFFRMVEENLHKVQYRVLLSRYRGKSVCPDCKGKRLKKETNYVKVGEKALMDLVDLPITELKTFFDSLQLSPNEEEIAKRLLYEIRTRIEYLIDVGLGYLTINRNSNTLSGGESQRIQLATSLGSSLVGSMYILDEPSIGLHSADTERLIGILKKLRDNGNTVIVVEHDEEIITSADYIVDLGPLAGSLGGEVMFSGNPEGLRNSESLTAKYLTGETNIPIPKIRRKPKHWIQIIGARQNNLKNINVSLPLDVLCVITGVSGSGKSSLLKDVLAPYMLRKMGYSGEKLGEVKEIIVPDGRVEHFELVDQKPVGKSSRSNPATYLKAFDDIRVLMSEQTSPSGKKFSPAHFSFNTPGGRCEECEGEGHITVSMQFMADIQITCEVCGGKRYKEEILDVQFKGKNIFDILELTIDEAVAFFNEYKQLKIVKKLEPLQMVGLGYLRLGQATATLSGGESQRLKIAYYLSKGTAQPKTLFVFDEPSTGLHFHDVAKLLDSFQKLLALDHSLMVIEHHLDIIKCADWIIDIGPEGGDNGGQIVAEGPPEMVARSKKSITGKFLQRKLF